MKNDKPSAEQGRAFLKSNWNLLEGVVSDQNRGIPNPEMQKRIPSGAEIINLISPDEFSAHETTLQEAVANRKSRRKYSDGALSLEDLSFLLWATQGVKRITPNHSLRSVPSAGARHAIETYIYVDRVEDLPQGLYRYLALEHKLCLLASDSDLDDRIDIALHRQRWNSAATFIWAALPYRMEWRYSIVAHKLIALDAGHICQNLYLACECIGCGTCAIGAYDQSLLDAAIGVDGRDEFAVYAAPVGKI